MNMTCSVKKQKFFVYRHAILSYGVYREHRLLA